MTTIVTAPTVFDLLATKVDAPATATDEHLAVFDGAPTKVKDGGAPAAGGGDFTGPASSVAGNFVVFDDTSGKVGEDSGLSPADFVTQVEKGAAGGVAELDGSTKVPIAQLPTGTGGSEVATGNHNHGLSGSVVGTSDSQVLTNKKLSDSTCTVCDNSDNTKELGFEVSGVTTGTKRVATVPNHDGILTLYTNASSAPGSPVDGQRFWHTDHREWYRWDAGLSKWLGEATHSWQLGSNRGSAVSTFNAGYSPSDSGQTSGAPGYFGDRKIRLVSLAWGMRVPNNSGVWTLKIDNQSGTIFTASNTVTGVANTWVKKNFETVGVSVAASDTLTVKATRGSGTETYQFVGIIQWCWEL